MSSLPLLHYTTMEEYLSNPVVGRCFLFTVLVTISIILSPSQMTKSAGRHKQNISFDYYTRRRSFRTAQLAFSSASGCPPKGPSQRDENSQAKSSYARIMSKPLLPRP